MIAVDINNQSVLQALERLQSALGPTELAVCLQHVGEGVVDRIDQRFATSTDPDGQKWAANTPATMAIYMRAKFKKGASGRSTARKKDGTLTKRASAVQANKKPLIAEGNLRSTIRAEVVGGHELHIGTNQKYAAVQQFGAKQGSLGGGAPWGDIPARRFMPLTASSTPDLIPSEAQLIEADIQNYIQSHAPD